MADDRVCQGYHVIKSRRIKDVEIVLAHNPSVTVTPYVTWKAYAHTQFQDFNHGNYFNDRDAAEIDFYSRILDTRKLYGLYPKKHKPPSNDERER